LELQTIAMVAALVENTRHGKHYSAHTDNPAATTRRVLRFV
jgi:hypothetical protein